MPSELRETVKKHLEHRLQSTNEVYIRSKQIAEELGDDVSVNQVAYELRTLVESPNEEFHIEKWGYTRRTTWRITSNNDAS